MEIKINNQYDGEIIIKEGTILNTNWGYDQTNVEYFKVIRVLGKRYFIIQELKKDYKENGFMCGNSTPEKEFKGEKIRGYASPKGYMNICEQGYKRSLYLWDKKPQAESHYA